MDSFDPILRAALKEIENVCKKYDIGGTIVLTSPSHTEYKVVFPNWSVFKTNGGNKGFLKIRSDEMENLIATMHMVLSCRDVCKMCANNFDEIVMQAKNYLKIDHTNHFTNEKEPLE